MQNNKLNEFNTTMYSSSKPAGECDVRDAEKEPLLRTEVEIEIQIDGSDQMLEDLAVENNSMGTQVMESSPSPTVEFRPVFKGIRLADVTAGRLSEHRKNSGKF